PSTALRFTHANELPREPNIRRTETETPMSSSNSTRRPGAGELRRALGVPSLVFFGLVYMVPLTVFTTYGIVTQVTGGRVPLAYVITLLAMRSEEHTS